LVERQLPKLKVAGSKPVFRSTSPLPFLSIDLTTYPSSLSFFAPSSDILFMVTFVISITAIAYFAFFGHVIGSRLFGRVTKPLPPERASTADSHASSHHDHAA
jgi:hypothetical protein